MAARLPAGRIRVYARAIGWREASATLAALSRHESITASYTGWGKLRNGELLRAAEESGFEIFVSGDQTIASEQTSADSGSRFSRCQLTNWPIIKTRISTA
jgi:hypothetical protein